MPRRALVIGLGVLTPLLALSAAVFLSLHSSTPMATVFPAQPIPGKQVSLDRAADLPSFSTSLMVPPSMVSDPCTGDGAILELRNAWIAEVGSESESIPPQLGMNYTEGVWVSMSAVETFGDSIAKGDELPPVVEAFSTDDFPEGLRDGSVRGHPAWIKDLGDFKCGETTASAISGDSVQAGELSDGLDEPDQPAVMFDPTVLASVQWMEDGYVIEVVGPYRADQLAAFAESMKPMESIR